MRGQCAIRKGHRVDQDAANIWPAAAKDITTERSGGADTDHERSVRRKGHRVGQDAANIWPAAAKDIMTLTMRGQCAIRKGHRVGQDAANIWPAAAKDITTERSGGADTDHERSVRY